MSDSAGPRTRGELSEAWLRHLGLQRGLSEHTVRAYVADVGDLLTFAQNGRVVSLRVEALGERRGPAEEARALYALTFE